MAAKQVLVTGIRRFSASAAQQQLVKPPIHVFGIEGRYATALYSAASKGKQLDTVEKELKAFQGNLGSSKVKDYFANPLIKRADKEAVLKGYLQSEKASDLTMNFFTVLAENNRLGKLDSVVNTFTQIMSAHRGEVICTITTAKALEAPEMKELEAALGGFLKKGESLMLNTKVDSSLLGGMVVEIGDKYVDMSTKSKINKFTNALKVAV